MPNGGFDPLRHVEGWCSHPQCDKKSVSGTDRCYKHRRPFDDPGSPQQTPTTEDQASPEDKRAVPSGGVEAKTAAGRRGSLQAQAEALLGLSAGPRFHRVDGLTADPNSGGKLGLSAQVSEADLQAAMDSGCGYLVSMQVKGRGRALRQACTRLGLPWDGLEFWEV